MAEIKKIIHFICLRRVPTPSVMEEILSRPMDPIQLPPNLDPDVVTGQEARTERCQGPRSEDVPMTTRP